MAILPSDDITTKNIKSSEKKENDGNTTITNTPPITNTENIITLKRPTFTKILVITVAALMVSSFLGG